jgi:RNA polymerase sigma factor (sigma-70 family)
MAGPGERGIAIGYRELVERHVNLVFATALRRSGNQESAKDLTQQVFIGLARKAAWLGPERSLSSWLHKTTVLEVRQWWRGELRRQRREQTAFELSQIMKETEPPPQAVAPVLDEALLELREPDRQVLLLRYFQGQSFRQIGALLGTGEDAARKRVTKALDQLIRLLRNRGHALSVAGLAAVLDSANQAAPLGLASAATHAGLAASSVTITATLGLPQPIRSQSLCRLARGASTDRRAMDGGTGSSSTLGAMNNLILILVVLAAAGAVVLNQTRSLAVIRIENHQLNNQRERLRTHLADLERRRGELEEHTRAARQEISRWSEQAPSVSRQNPDPIVAPDPLRQGGWPQGTSYFYLPKRDLKSVGYMVFDRDRLSDEAAALFGMSAAEREAVDAAYNRLWQDFRALEIQSLEPVPPPDRWKTMVESISYRIQALDREAGELRTEYETAVNQILGPTRTPI